MSSLSVLSRANNFNPRSPHGERPTCSPSRTPEDRHFNPRSPHGERHEQSGTLLSPLPFQSTLPARGATRQPLFVVVLSTLFQSTLPARGATGLAPQLSLSMEISIHAPRTGSDFVRQGRCAHHGNFNPRSPHGERREAVFGAVTLLAFQSTLPARGATFCCMGFAPATRNFNPRSPHGERLRKVTILSIRIIGFAQKVYHKTVLLRISLAENAVILPEKPRNPVRTSLQKAGGLRFARAIRAARPYSISSPSGA